MNKKQEILNFFKLRDNIEQVVKEYVQDKSIPLEDRWEIFEQSGFGDDGCYIPHLESLHDDIVMYDGLVNVDRRETVCVFNILKQYFYAKKEYEEGDYTEDFIKWQNFNFDPVAFQEECLAKFIKGWVYDW